MSDTSIRSFLEHLGRSVSNGDAKAIALCWAVPAMVLSDKEALSITELKQVEEFFEKSTAWYRSQGVATTKPDVKRIEWLSEGVAAIDVGWPGFNEAGQELSTETSHYLVQLDAQGAPRIRVAMIRTT